MVFINAFYVFGISGKSTDSAMEITIGNEAGPG
jgi:hypothetical protein